MGQRIAPWLIVLALCGPLVLMAWYPTTFSVALQFVLRNSLDLVLLLCLAVLIAREAHSRSRDDISGVLLLRSLPRRLALPGTTKYIRPLARSRWPCAFRAFC
jgi:hypothetical protein